MNGERISIFITKLFQMCQIIVFFLLNRYKFKNLAFKSLIIKPLLIVGSRYMVISKGVIIKKQSSLFALKLYDKDPVLEIGTGCSLGHFNHVAAVKKVVLGKYVLTADNVYISDNFHEFKDINIPIMHQPVKFKAAVHIGDGSWIGENACIIGANIGRNCVIGANSVVTKDIPDYSVAVGAPADVTSRYNQIKKNWEKI